MVANNLKTNYHRGAENLILQLHLRHLRAATVYSGQRSNEAVLERYINVTVSAKLQNLQNPSGAVAPVRCHPQQVG